MLGHSLKLWGGKGFNNVCIMLHSVMSLTAMIMCDPPSCLSFLCRKDIRYVEILNGSESCHDAIGVSMICVLPSYFMLSFNSV